MEISSWLSETPKYTTFRVNKLKEFDVSILQKFLADQSIKLKTKCLPKFYFLSEDCVIVERWPEEVSIDLSGNEVIVDVHCAAAVLRGANVYAPGVMGLPTNCKINEPVDIYGDVNGLCKRGLKVKFEGAKQYVGSGILKMLRYELFDNGVQPSGIAIETLLPASRLPVVNETLFPHGEVVLQNLPSIVCGWVVNAKPFEYILDMCAAPGNKTTHLAEMAGNQAIITAIDKTSQKVAKIIENCNKQGVTCVSAYAFDSTKCYSQDSNGIDKGPPFNSECFDKILLDAPCSGLGQRPQLSNKMTPKMIQSYKFVQRKLFIAAAKILKVGGKLTYSTCTITDEENEGMVVWVLENIPFLKMIAAEPLLGGPGLPNKGLNDEQRIMVQRFGPENDPLRLAKEIYRDSIGFFIAQFVKVS